MNEINAAYDAIKSGEADRYGSNGGTAPAATAVTATGYGQQEQDPWDSLGSRQLERLGISAAVRRRYQERNGIPRG